MERKITTSTLEARKHSPSCQKMGCGRIRSEMGVERVVWFGPGMSEEIVVEFASVGSGAGSRGSSVKEIEVCKWSATACKSSANGL